MNDRSVPDPAATGPRRRRHAVPQFLLGCALVLGAGLAPAQPPDTGALRIEQPWSRATAPGVAVGAGYLRITNAGATDDALLAASTPLAAAVEMHESRLDGGIMRMRKLARIAVPAGQTVAFEPGGLHLMLMGLKQPLAAGTTVPVVLRFEKAGERRIELSVQAPGAQSNAAGGAQRPQP